MIEFKKILFPCDFTDASQKVLPYAVSTAEKYGAKLYIFHAVDDLEGWGGVYVPYSHRQDIVTQAMEQAGKRRTRHFVPDRPGKRGDVRRRIRPSAAPTFH